MTSLGANWFEYSSLLYRHWRSIASGLLGPTVHSKVEVWIEWLYYVHSSNSQILKKVADR